MGDAQLAVCVYQGVVQKLPFFMGHIRDQQGEKDVEPLNLCRQQGFFHAGTIQQLVYGLVHLANLHDIDTILRGRRNLDELPANVGAGPVELMPL